MLYVFTHRTSARRTVHHKAPRCMPQKPVVHPLTLSTHPPQVLRVPQPLSLSSYFLTVSSFIICSFLCICRGSSKLQTGKRLPSSNLGPSYCSPVHMEVRDHPGSPTLSSQGSPLSGPSLLLASPIPLLSRLLLLQIVLAATGSPLTTKAGSPREWSTEKKEKERWEGQERKPYCKPGEGSILLSLSSAGKFCFKYDSCLLAHP